jgi:hypothetical protein
MTAPAKKRAKSTSVHSYVVRARNPTLSPGSMPAATKPFARAITSRSNSAA